LQLPKRVVAHWGDILLCDYLLKDETPSDAVMKWREVLGATTDVDAVHSVESVSAIQTVPTAAIPAVASTDVKPGSAQPVSTTAPVATKIPPNFIVLMSIVAVVVIFVAWWFR